MIREHTRSLMFPYCGVCDLHVKRWRSAATIANVVFWLCVVVGILASLAGGGAPAFMACMTLGAVLAIVAYYHVRGRARAMSRETCSGPSTAVLHLGWSGIVSRFGFESNAYAVSFARANAEKLINVSMELRQLLEAPPIDAYPRMEMPRSVSSRRYATPRVEASVSRSRC